jgi:hypothetical protein
MEAFRDNLDTTTNTFEDGAAVPRQAGYWIESYATKVVDPAPGGGLTRLRQATRGRSRPDVVLQKGNVDLAWLDITSDKSEGHIFDKDSDGWNSTPYVTEVTYPGLRVQELNQVAIPGKGAVDISALLARAEKARRDNQRWQLELIRERARDFREVLREAFADVKNEAVRAEDELSGEEHDRLYGDDSEDNRFAEEAVRAVAKWTGREVDVHDLTAALMFFDYILHQYEARTKRKVDAPFWPLTKKQLGLSWVDDVSSADGEPVVREWFPAG